MAYPRWMYGNPCDVAASLEAHRNKPTKSERARMGLEELFQGDTMGAEMKRISKVHLRTMFQWGDWAKRPHYWANHRVTPFCRLLGIMQNRWGVRDVKLDPQSLAIHKSVMGRDEKTQAVLYAYYVMNLTFDQAERQFRCIGISRMTFYRYLETGTRMVCSGIDTHEKEEPKIVGTKTGVLGHNSAMV